LSKFSVGDVEIMVSDELLRRAIFDRDVRKRRVVAYRAGLTVDAEDLLLAVRRVMPEQPPGRADVDAAVRRHGGDFTTYPLKRPVGWLIGRLTAGRVSVGRPEYWLDMHAWQRLRQQRANRRKIDR
jgi:hypothetical protein